MIIHKAKSVLSAIFTSKANYSIQCFEMRKNLGQELNVENNSPNTHLWMTHLPSSHPIVAQGKPWCMYGTRKSGTTENADPTLRRFTFIQQHHFSTSITQVVSCYDKRTKVMPTDPAVPCYLSNREIRQC